MSLADLLALSHGLGLKVLVDDLGDWSNSQLRSEFDPSENAIRINARLVRTMDDEDANAFVARAIAHEIYHYLEYSGCVRSDAKRSNSEAKAEQFADSLRALA